MASGWYGTRLTTPGTPFDASTFAIASSLALDGSSDYLGFPFLSETSGAITQLGYRQTAVTGTSPTYRISLQGVDAAGGPDGTVKGGGSPASATFTPAGANDGTWQWVTLDNSYSPNLGELLCITIDYSSGTIDGSNNTSFLAGYNNQTLGTANFPYSVGFAGVSEAKNSYTIYGYRTASRRYGHIVESFSMESLSTSGHRGGLAFTFTPEGASAYEVIGGNFQVDPPASGNIKFGLWNTSNTLLASTTMVGLQFQNPALERATIIYFDSAASLTPGTKYYIGYEADGNAFEYANYTVAENADLECWTGDSEFAHATYNGSTWSETTTEAPLIQPIIGSVTGNAGGAAGLPLVIGG